ncbi:MAG: hypothetical protein AB7S38_39515 [Vulcanimicrobiota bacterium]
MHIQSNPSAKKAVFSYNPQDAQVAKPQTTEIDTVRLGGAPATDKVQLRNFFLVTDIFGRPTGLEPDASLKLNANADGQFVFNEGSLDYTAANSFAAAAKTVQIFDEKMQQYTGKSIKWAFNEDQLGIAPNAGAKLPQPMPNAFYTRFAFEEGGPEQGNLFFFDYPNAAGKNTSTGNSGEVVSHEAGHAILDALRPNYFTSMAFEAGAFHEAFGDMVSMLVSMENDQVLDKVVEQTGGDLSNPNILAELGEEMGKSIGRSAVRDNRNNFKYVDPDTLPEEAPDNRLARESHSFARVWTGAFYELMDSISDDYRAKGAEPKEALQKAAQEGWRLLVGQMDNSTEGSFVTFRGMAESMLEGDRKVNGGERQEMITKVFTGRQILPRGLNLEHGITASVERGELREMSFQLGDKFGDLSGVTVKAHNERGIFAADDDAIKQKALEKEVARLAANGDIFIPEEGHKATLADFFRPDGSHYHAYLDRDANELKRVPLS